MLSSNDEQWLLRQLDRLNENLDALRANTFACAEAMEMHNIMSAMSHVLNTYPHLRADDAADERESVVRWWLETSREYAGP